MSVMAKIILKRGSFNGIFSVTKIFADAIKGFALVFLELLILHLENEYFGEKTYHLSLTDRVN